LVLSGVFAQERDPVPSFPTKTDLITVDVVVLDKNGRPVRGLTKADFSVFEDGQLQEVVGFEARDLTTSRPTEDTSAVGLPGREEEPRGPPGRRLAFILDELGLDARCAAAIESIRTWIREKADPRDEVTLVNATGTVRAEERIGSGRGALLNALARIRCRRPMQPPEASRCGESIVGPTADPGAIAGCVRAQEARNDWRLRARDVVASIEAFSRAHADERGRKPVFVFTNSFVRDDDLKQAEQAVEAAHRTNTVLYVVDPRGLVGGMYDDVLAAAWGTDLGGAAHMADETGGSLIRSNDVAGAIYRAIDESAAYYLLGYVPTRPPDGRWRPLQVKVSRPGFKVRARRGYLAATEPARTRSSADAPEDR
jgi:VWFA-related protein